MTVKLLFNVRETTSPPTMVVELVGIIDSSKCLERLHEIVTASTLNDILIIFSGVDYVNSAGFAEVVVLNERAGLEKKRLILVDLSPKVQSVFEHLGGLQILEVHNSEEDALRKIARSNNSS